MGLVQAESYQSAEALTTTRAALQDHPNDAQLNFLLARILIDDGAGLGSPKFGEATRAAEAAVRIKPDLLSARDLLAKIDDVRGDSCPLPEIGGRLFRVIGLVFPYQAWS